MRPGALVALLLALGTSCQSDDGGLGTYLVFESPTTFDQVEVFFGRATGDAVPTTPRHATPVIGTQQRMARVFTEDDAPVPRRDVSPSWTYYLPPDEANRMLGEYAMVIASSDGTPVAIGELFDFKVLTDELRQYTVPMVAIANQDVERWGTPTESCVRWSHDRGDKPTTIAVVRDEDSDCDGFVDQDDANADCRPLDYCDGSGTGACLGATTCLSDVDGSCMAGSCSNSTGSRVSCAPQLCLERGLCNSGCTVADPLSLVVCSIEAGASHIDYNVAVGVGNALCEATYPLAVRLPVPCVDPEVDGSLNWLAGPEFAFAIAPGATLNTCILTIKEPLLDAPFTGVPHVLISVANPPGAPLARSEILFGLSPGGTCPGEGIDVAVDLGSCGEPP